ncbi:MAG TPA: SDR family oxidoreductase [Candidatus Wallbacteria bacterium]|nr:SDR family oxidoreductase [Candidatus Wallbacteria bacterium]
MNTFPGKIVFITGASSGIGEASAWKFAEAGARLIITARRLENLTALSKKISEKYGVKILAIQLDVTKHAAVRDTIENLPAEWKDIDILINNAGLAIGTDRFQESDPDEWEAVIDTNIKGLLYCTRHVLKNMLKRNSGHIINIGSLAGHEVYAGGSVYCATKHAVLAISKILKLDLVGTDIRVSSIDPGMVETGFSVVRFRGDKNRAKKVYEGMTPLTADDVAEAVIFCAGRPPHVNISEIIMMPTDQASVTSVNRKSK